MGRIRLPLGGVFSGQQFYFLVNIRKNLRIEIIMISKEYVILEQERCGSRKNLKFEEQLTLDPKPIIWW